MKRFCLEAEFVLFGPQKFCQADSLRISLLFAFRNHMDRHRAVLVVGPGEAHQIGGGHDTGLLFCFPKFVNQGNHRFYGRGGLLPGDQNRDADPGGMGFHAIFKDVNRHVCRMLSGFITICVGRTFIADEAVAVSVHPVGHCRMHIQGREDRNIGKQSAEFF